MADEAVKTRKPRKSASSGAGQQADLQEQVSQLTSLVASLQEQLATLAAAPVAAHTPQNPAPHEPSQLLSETPLAAPVLTLEAEPSAEDLEEQGVPKEFSEDPEEGDHSLPGYAVGVEDHDFRPFDPSEFASDFESAFSNPLPVDWSLFAVDEAPEHDVEEGEPVRALYEEMLDKNPDLAPSVIAHNRENTPDFVVKDLFWEVVEEREGHEILEEFLHPPEPESPWANADLPFDQSILDDLLAEAAMAEAAPPEPEPLDDIDVSGWRDAIGGGSAPKLDFEEEDQGLPPLDPLEPLGDTPSKEALEAAPPHLAIRALALPMRIEEGRLVCRVAKPFDEEALAALREEVALPIDVEPHPISMVVKGLRRAYSDGNDDHARVDLLEGAAPRTDTLMSRLAGWVGMGKTG